MRSQLQGTPCGPARRGAEEEALTELLSEPAAQRVAGLIVPAVG